MTDASRTDDATPRAGLPPFVQPLSHGVTAIDTGFHRPSFDAAYLVVDDGRAAFVDCGTALAVPRLLQALDSLGVPRDAVEWVIPTHVHLDHAGGAGALMQALPAARMLVHPRGARHMVDPSALWAGATAVYGEAAMRRDYDRVVPVPAARIHESHDGQVLALGGRTLTVIDAPGHARHHHALFDSASRGWFSGDTFGLSYRELDTPLGAWIVPTSTPVQFDPVALAATVRRMLRAEPDWLYLTHYGRVGDVARLGALFLDLLDRTVTLARGVAAGPDRHEALKAALLALYQRSLQEHGCPLPAAQTVQLLAIDVELNAQGIAIWLDR